MTTSPEQPTANGWTPDDSTFGARLALVRQRMGWGNVREAATACGIPPESWRTWERDNVEPRRVVEMAGLIAGRTGCDFGWLLAGPRLREAGDQAATDEPRNPRRRGREHTATRITHGFTGWTVPLPTQGMRPRDNRPLGHPATNGIRRSTPVARTPRTQRP